MLCEPKDKEDVWNTALPEDTGAEPIMVVAPPEVSTNCTVPVAKLGDTLAVNITDWPTVEGFVDEEIVVVEEAPYAT